MTPEHESWIRTSDSRLWYWRTTLDFLVEQPTRSEAIGQLLRRYLHASKDESRHALDHLDHLIEVQDLSDEATVQEAIATLKEMHRAGSM
jgi:metal-responsive CopG/Arc/MetJ family transcriptional regulator